MVFDFETAYKGIKKCVLNDYPYDLDWDDSFIFPHFCNVCESLLSEFSLMKDPYYSDDKGNGILRLDFIDHYILLSYKLANYFWKQDRSHLSDAIYYSMRFRGNIDLFYKAELGKFCRFGHPLGSVIDSHAKYGECITFDDSVHIGPNNYFNKSREEVIHPTFGSYIQMLNHSSVFGDSHIGNNVVISVGTRIIDEDIPDNCIVFGSSPNLYFAPLKIKLKDFLLK